MFRWFAARALVKRIADQGAQLLGVGTGKLRDKFGYRQGLGEQAISPALDVVQLCGAFGGCRAPGFELRANRRRIDAAHQLADVLQLASARAEGGYGTCGVHGFAQIFRQIDGSQLPLAQGYQLGAGLLQCIHVALALRFAWGVAGDVLRPGIFFHGIRRKKASCYDNALYRAAIARAPFPSETMADTQFSYSADTLKQLVTDALDHARSRGATAADVEVSEAFGQTVTARNDEVETIEYNRDKGIGVTVYIGKQRGHASSSDLSPKALRDTVDAALAIAQYTATDDCAGLADPDRLAREFPDLELMHAWDMPVERAIKMARECEAAGLAVDKRITNSEGATISTQQSHFIYGNTHGFLAGYPSSRHSIWCSLIAGKDDGMQRDDWYETTRNPDQLPAPALIGRKAGERAVARLKARKIPTRQDVPVLYESGVAASLMGHFVTAVSGGSLYRKSSFLLDSLGQTVFSPCVQMSDLPHIAQGLASGAFDEEGVATQARDIVKDGVVQGYFLASYSARKLGMQSTGNAGGNHNLILRDTGEDFAGLLKKMGTGLLVTELMGQGVNAVTGDYSRGASGFWVENGAIAYPVQEITIAGNLKTMFKNIVAIGNDVSLRSSRQCGSILVSGMTLAGS